jgi:hypothetical protein
MGGESNCRIPSKDRVLTQGRKAAKAFLGPDAWISRHDFILDRKLA